MNTIPAAQPQRRPGVDWYAYSVVIEDQDDNTVDRVATVTGDPAHPQGRDVVWTDDHRVDPVGPSPEDRAWAAAGYGRIADGRVTPTPDPALLDLPAAHALVAAVHAVDQDDSTLRAFRLRGTEHEGEGYGFIRVDVYVHDLDREAALVVDHVRRTGLWWVTVQEYDATGAVCRETEVCHDLDSATAALAIAGVLHAEAARP